MPSCAPDPSSQAPAKACWGQETMATPSSPGLVVLSQQHRGWGSAGTGRTSQATLPSPSFHPAASLSVGELPRPGRLLPAKGTMGYPQGCLGVSGAGPQAGRRVQQPSGSRGHCPAGQCSRNSLGVSIFSVQRTGQLYGGRNKAASVCRPRGWGAGAARRVVNPARSPGRWQSQASQEPPTLLPKGEGGRFLPPGRQGVPEDGQRPLPALGGRSLPSCSGMCRGLASEVSPALTPLSAHKHLLRAFCVPRLSGPRGAATKTLPRCEISPECPRGRGRAGSEQLLWGWASEVTETPGLEPLPVPTCHRRGGRRRRTGTTSLLRWAFLSHVTPATGHRAAPQLSVSPTPQAPQVEPKPVPAPRVSGAPGAWDGDRAPAAPTLSHHPVPALSHTHSSGHTAGRRAPP